MISYRNFTSFLVFIVCIVCITCQLSGALYAQSVKDATHDDTSDGARAVVDMVSDTASDTLYTEGTNATTSSDAVSIYLPTDSSGASVNNANYTYYNSNALPKITGNATTNNARLRFTLDLDIQSGYDKLYLGVFHTTDNEYKTVLIDNSVSGGDGQQFLVNLADICSSADANDLNCSKLETGDEPTIENVEDVNLVLFLYNDATVISKIDASSINYGTYYKLNMRNKVYSSFNIDLNSLTKGDTQLSADFTGFVVDAIESTFALIEENQCSTTAASTLSGAYSKSNFTDLDTDIVSGVVKIKGLENNTCYGIRIVFCDKFGFCSKLSNRLFETPEEIEALLLKQGCFFFTAGFEGSHWVIDYFRNYRDEVLRKNFFGRLFVKFYYQVGPKYAPWLLDKPLLQKMVRGFAYVLYACIHYFYYILSTLALGAAVFISVAKLKAKRGEQGYGRS